MKSDGGCYFWGGPHEETHEGREEGSSERLPGRRTSRCKGPEAQAPLVLWRNGKKAQVAKAAKVSGKKGRRTAG